MIMKKAVILVCLFLVLLTGCISDPYSNKRPFDYGEAKWVCEEHNIWFCVDMKKEDYYYPEGEVQLDGNTYFCKFYFIHQTNQVSISVYPLEYATIPDTERDRCKILAELDGDCSFSKESLTIFVETESDTIFNKKIDSLTFLRVESQVE